MNLLKWEAGVIYNKAEGRRGDREKDTSYADCGMRISEYLKQHERAWRKAESLKLKAQRKNIAPDWAVMCAAECTT